MVIVVVVFVIACEFSTHGVHGSACVVLQSCVRCVPPDRVFFVTSVVYTSNSSVDRYTQCINYA